MRPHIAVLSPAAAPDAPEPSTARRMARLMHRALDRAGFNAFSLRQQGSGGADGCVELDDAPAAAWQLAASLQDRRFALVLGCGVRPDAPDLIGPSLARAIGAPYAIVGGRRHPLHERSPTGRSLAAEAAFDAARLVFWTDPDTLPALHARRPVGQLLAHLPPFTALGAPATRPATASGPLRLLAATMFDQPDKAAAAGRLAAALGMVDSHDWRLDVMGGGPFAGQARAALAPLGARMTWLGGRDLRRDVHERYAAADLVVWPDPVAWPAMTAMEAQATGRAAIFADCPAVRAVLAPECPSPPAGDVEGFAAAIAAFALDRHALATAGAAARRWMEARHGIEAAARRIAQALAAIGVQPCGPT